MSLLSNSSQFCLSLNRRPDRRIRAWEQFRREDLVVKKIAAPDAASVTEARGWKNTGARACALGHRKAWRAALRKGQSDAALIFEDDVVLCRNFRKDANALSIPPDWGLIYFGCIFVDPPEPVSEGLVRVTGRTWETHAMMVHSRLFPRLHRLLAPWSRRRGPREHPWVKEIALDNLLAEIHRDEPVYAAYPALAWQSWGLSNIENGVRCLWDGDGNQLPLPEITEELDRKMGRQRTSRKASGESSPESQEGVA